MSLNNKLFRKLYLSGCEIKLDESLANYTTIRIGGRVDAVVFPMTIQAFSKCLEVLKAHSVPFKILGGGSNVVPPKSFNGIAVHTRYLANVRISGNKITAECGVPLRRVLDIAAEGGLSGLEFASGIPGTLGGALYMNAGAFGGEMSQVVESVSVLDDNLKPKKLSVEEIGYGYRQSLFKKNGLTILSATLSLHEGKPEKIREKMQEILSKRLEKQPIHLPSAGSVFLRPKPDFYVGSTIDKLGLKGLRVGGVEVSRKHAGFIVNVGGGTQRDLVELIEKIKARVYEKTGVILQTEIDIW
ncbi:MULTISPECIES: UDP-N-acetylmuramate dehydrogenase [Kosmotoga]|uniref:UDP-N-acetylenolpyruvoylglucosamine reductase n=1 Tax=Kosmotoga olearia (strain ATCC BAA-1733 / DSM 21960 / TBF 19.5.1) TaxID=521045 RepID=C5CD42_KOSOT|nr:MULTISPECIES: UDP-N-acetylmuramate dehydrogenase [Kosmotoga]ACR78986.1 UDP-N-acetylenolpyruvoylglucosamine reductase [Kosmotoga olearia TBF 19.5.1]OAA24037.1 UDP-N-acetylenolpyruvoylglucosamine reductase [Kosmotoga sp. DU53]